MSLNSTPSGERLHIGIFGKRNAGKSSIINAITSQKLAIVSDIPGTTTDPVSKAMELLPLGPVLITDTPGLDDTGELGAKRVSMAIRVLENTDLALLVVNAACGMSDFDTDILSQIKKRRIPCIIINNKWDLIDENHRKSEDFPKNVSGCTVINVSAATGYNIYELRQCIAGAIPDDVQEAPIISDLVNKGDTVVLVIPIDESAPKGRLILPQQQTIRELLEAGAFSVCVQDSGLADYLSQNPAPNLVVTDSQAFAYVSKVVPESIPLTSFSILMAKHKGNLIPAVRGAGSIKALTDSSRVLISEGCTHHRQCNDIGTKKLPDLIRRFTGANPKFEYTSGREFPSGEELKKYSLIIHCGGCMLNEREMKYRYAMALSAGIPVTNYGIALSYMNGILERCTCMIPSVSDNITVNG